MSRQLELSRRRILVGLGAIGAAGAGAGLGTSAYFSDEESFEDNTLTAGKLDLKVDWEEHYSYPQVYGMGDPTENGELDVTRSQPSDTSEYRALPTPQNPLVWVHDDDLDDYMDNTAIEAFPDSDDNGVQDALEDYDACEDFADTPDDLDPTAGLRTENADTAGDPYAPLVNLHDVKPGDFGELTLSFHLCDNPGYVWLQGGLVEARENERTEPESSAPDETGDSDDVATSLDDSAADDVELLNSVRTCLWYDDDGDNVYDPGAEEEEVDLVVAFDQSESMNAENGGSDDDNPSKLDAAVSGANSLVGTVGATTNLGLVMFSSPDMTQVVRPLGSSKSTIQGDLDDLDGPDDTSSPINDNNDDPNSEGNESPQVDSNDDGEDDDNLLYQTDLEGGIEAANDELTGTNARSGARKIMVLLTDGQPFLADGNQTNSDVTSAANDAKNDDIEIFTIAYGDNADEGLMADVASDPEDTHAFSGGEADIESIFGQIGQIIGGEKKFFDGSLRDLLAELESGRGIPLDGNRDTLYDELDDPPDDPDRDEFVDSTNNFIGFAWWLPTSVGNEVQSDSVSFDLGFYTEQSRHNDGSGTAAD